MGRIAKLYELSIANSGHLKATFNLVFLKGWEGDLAESKTIAERVYGLKRLFESEQHQKRLGISHLALATTKS